MYQCIHICVNMLIYVHNVCELPLVGGFES